MKDLLTNIINAHGGIDRWNSFQKVEATIVSGGELWGMKGLVQDANPRRMTVSLHEEFASVTPFGAADQRTSFTPDRIAIEKLDGTVVAERRDPRALFDGHEMLTPWGPLAPRLLQRLRAVDLSDHAVSSGDEGRRGFGTRTMARRQ